MPVTVIEALPNRVTQVKGAEGDGYRAIQVTYGNRTPSRLNKAVAGHFAKAKVEPGQWLWSSASPRRKARTRQAGAELKVDSSRRPDRRRHGHDDRQGLRRHDEASQLRGGHRVARRLLSHRAPARSASARRQAACSPASACRPHGPVRRTTENLQVVEVDAERDLLLIRGAVPGAPGGEVIVRPSVKAAVARLARRSRRPSRPARKQEVRGHMKLKLAMAAPAVE